MKIRVAVTLTPVPSSDGSLYLSTEDFMLSSVWYKGAIMSSGSLFASQEEQLFGRMTIDPVTIEIANADGDMSSEFKLKEWRGGEMTYKMVDLDTSTVIGDEKTFKIDSMEISSRSCSVSVSSADVDAWEDTLPRYKLTPELFGIESDEMDDSAKNKPCSTWFGEALKVPCWSIYEGGTGDDYRHDFFVCLGEMESIVQVYSVEDDSSRDVGTGEYIYHNGVVLTGTSSTSITSTSMTVTGQTFVTDGVKVGDILHNTTDTREAVITGVTETVISFDDIGTPNLFDSSSEDWRINNRYYDVDQLPFAFLEFYGEQRDSSGNLLEIFADVQGVKLTDGTYSFNPILLFEEFITNEIWGLGLDVSSSTFSASAPATSSYEFRMTNGLYTFRKAYEWRDAFCKSCRLSQLSLGDSGYELYYPEFDAIDQYDFTSVNIANARLSRRSVDEYVNEVVVVFNYDHTEGKFIDEVRSETGESFGTSYEVTAPFVSDESSALSLAVFMKNRFQFQDLFIEFTTQHQGLALEIHHIFTVTFGAINLDGERFEVIEIDKTSEETKIVGASYTSEIYQES